MFRGASTGFYLYLFRVSMFRKRIKKKERNGDIVEFVYVFLVLHSSRENIERTEEEIKKI